MISCVSPYVKQERTLTTSLGSNQCLRNQNICPAFQKAENSPVPTLFTNTSLGLRGGKGSYPEALNP